MESNIHPLLYYLIQKPKGAFAILAATDLEMQELYTEGVRWHGVPFKTRAEAEAEAVLEAVKSKLTH